MRYIIYGLIALGVFVTYWLDTKRLTQLILWLLIALVLVTSLPNLDLSWF